MLPLLGYVPLHPWEEGSKNKGRKGKNLKIKIKIIIRTRKQLFLLIYCPERERGQDVQRGGAGWRRREDEWENVSEWDVSVPSPLKDTKRENTKSAGISSHRTPSYPPDSSCNSVPIMNSQRAISFKSASVPYTACTPHQGRRQHKEYNALGSWP